MSKSNYHITKCLWPSQIIQTKPYLSSGQFLQLSVDLECLARCFFSQTMWMHLLKMTKIKSKNQLLTLSNYSATLAFFVWVLTYLYFVFLSIASERIAMKTRVAYFKSLLYADIDWLENSQQKSEKTSKNHQNLMSMVEKRSTLELS